MKVKEVIEILKRHNEELECVIQQVDDSEEFYGITMIVETTICKSDSDEEVDVVALCC